eukprot:scaffold15_cov204-Amphora_coffeaeformis.AAC.17
MQLLVWYLTANNEKVCPNGKRSTAQKRGKNTIMVEKHGERAVASRQYDDSALYGTQSWTNS